MKAGNSRIFKLVISIVRKNENRFKNTHTHTWGKYPFVGNCLLFLWMSIRGYRIHSKRIVRTLLEQLGLRDRRPNLLAGIRFQFQ